MALAYSLMAPEETIILFLQDDFVEDLNGGYVLCLWSFGAIYNFKCNLLTIVERSTPFSVDCAIMHKNIGSFLSFNETKTFGVVKPLYGSGYRVA